MKTSQAVIVIIVLFIIGIFVFMWSGNKKVVVNNPVNENTEQTPAETQAESVLGCYTATSGNNVYTLNIRSQIGSTVLGTLGIKNAEKDSSSGTISGAYSNGVLLADYTFKSEGTESVMQVIFKKSGNDFIRGYGDVNSDGTRFLDTNKITYDSSSPLSIFKAGECPQM